MAGAAVMPTDEALEEGPPARSVWGRALRRLLRKRLALAALLLIGCFYFVGLFAPLLAPYDYRDTNVEELQFQGPSLAHPFGTDRIGRDLLTHVIWSARTTMIVTVATVVAGGLVLGVGLGLLAGYVGGKTDTAIMRTGEIFISLPGLPMLILINATMAPRVEKAVEWLESHISSDALQEALEARAGPEFVFLALLGALAVAGVAGLAAWLVAGEERRRGAWLTPFIIVAIVVTSLWAVQAIFATDGAADYFLIFGALSLFSWAGGARVIRSQVLAIRETEYVLAARAMGASTWRIVGSHLLPNVMPIIIVGLSAGLGGIAGSEVALTFLGVGVHEPTPSFGAMISRAASINLLEDYPHLLLAPGIVVALLIFSFNLLGDALNDVLTPRAR